MYCPSDRKPHSSIFEYRLHHILVSHATPLNQEGKRGDHAYSELYQCPKTGRDQSDSRFEQNRVTSLLWYSINMCKCVICDRMIA